MLFGHKSVNFVHVFLNINLLYRDVDEPNCPNLTTTHQTPFNSSQHHSSQASTSQAVANIGGAIGGAVGGPLPSPMQPTAGPKYGSKHRQATTPTSQHLPRLKTGERIRRRRNDKVLICAHISLMLLNLYGIVNVYSQ